MMDESLVCINCGSEVKPKVDNSLEICFDCQLNLGILSKMKREYHNKFKYSVVLFYDIALDTDVLIGIFLVGITIITTLVVILNSSK